jgi:hypothetical protein
MSKINDIVVLNTVTTSTDPQTNLVSTPVMVDANGFLNVVGADSIKASRIQNMQIQPYVAEVLQETTVTIGTVTDGATYTLAIQGTNMQTGVAYFNSYSVVAGAGASTTTICDAFRSLIANDPYVNVTASGTTTLVLTAKSGYPAFSVLENDPKLSFTTGTTAVIGVGLGSKISASYPASSFPAIANIVAAGQYTTVTIEHEDVSAYGEASALPNQYKTLTIFVREAVTNVDTLVGDYGTLTALKQGYRAVISAPATTTAAVTVTTGAIALADGSATFASLAAQSGDWIAIGAATTKITGITGAAAGFGTNVAAVGAATFLFSAWRNLPA